MYEEIERRLVDNPDDREAWQVYSDWLQEQGDPRGELIALEMAGQTEAAAVHQQKNAAELLGPLAAHQKTYDGEDTDAFQWKHGFIERLRLSHDYYGDEDFEGRLVDVLRAVLDHRSGRFLRDLTFVYNRDPSEDTLQDLIDLLAEQVRPTLRKLHFGDYNYAGPSDLSATGQGEISWYSIGDLSALWPAVPNLRTLITQGGSRESTIAEVGVQLGALGLPRLQHAEFRSGGLEKETAQSIAAGKFPALERLFIWYGDPNYGGTADADDVQPLLERHDLPHLRHLGLMNAMFTDELPQRLLRCPLLAQLEVLDLSMGCMEGPGVDVFINNADAFKHLRAIDVSANYLNADQVAALQRALPMVTSATQRDPERSEYRYPAVGE